MTREQVEQFLKDELLIEAPTKEQIDAYLNKFNAETKDLKDKAKSLGDKTKEIEELQTKLKELENANLSDVEKAQKETEEANKQIADLNAKIRKIETQKKLAELGITGDQAEKFFAEDGSLDFSVLGQVLTEREAKAKSDKEKELLNGTPDPSGKGGSDDDSTDDSFAKEIASHLTANNGSSEIISKYL